MVFKQAQMALPAHGHIIEEPEEDYHGAENKTAAGKKKTVLVRGWSNSQKKKKIREERAGGNERQNMFGECSTTCLQFIINFLEPSQSYGCGAHASRAIPFHWQMWLCGVLLCLFTCFFPLCQPSTWGSVRKHMLPEGQNAHSLSAGEIQQSFHMRPLDDWMDGKRVVENSRGLFLYFTVYICIFPLSC